LWCGGRGKELEAATIVRYFFDMFSVQGTKKEDCSVNQGRGRNDEEGVERVEEWLIEATKDETAPQR